MGSPSWRRAQYLLLHWLAPIMWISIADIRGHRPMFLADRLLDQQHHNAKTAHVIYCLLRTEQEPISRTEDA